MSQGEIRALNYYLSKQVQVPCFPQSASFVASLAHFLDGKAEVQRSVLAWLRTTPGGHGLKKGLTHRLELGLAPDLVSKLGPASFVSASLYSGDRKLNYLLPRPRVLN